MPSIVTCTCGAKVRIADGMSAARCPRCREPLAVALSVQVLSAHAARPGEIGAACPICQTTVAADQSVLTCPTCQTIHHQECWEEVGGCGTYGCNKAPAAEKGKPAGTATAAWGDTKTCPACGETIRSLALKCRFCEVEFGTADPMTRKEFRARQERKDTQQSIRIATWVIFGLSLVPFCGPLMLCVNAVWVPVYRVPISRAGPMYPLLAYVGLAMSALYLVLIGGFLLLDLATR